MMPALCIASSDHCVTLLAALLCCCVVQVASLGRQLLQERTKVRALGEELENPLNVHRWGHVDDHIR
jgi:hypothetical protein